MRADKSIPLTVGEATPEMIGRMSRNLSQFSREEFAASAIHSEDIILSLLASVHTGDYAYAIDQAGHPVCIFGAFRDYDEPETWRVWSVFSDLFYQRGIESTIIIHEKLRLGIDTHKPKRIVASGWRMTDRVLKWDRKLGFLPTDRNPDGWTEIEYAPELLSADKE